MTEGHYLALEGIEGAGKSTVGGRLSERLAGLGHRVLTVREPGGTPIGERVREVLLVEEHALTPWSEALLFAAARAQLVAEVLTPALRDGSWVVSDRSVYSSLAYQGGGRRLGVQEVRAINAPGLGETWPELVVLLRVDPETGLGRQQGLDRIGAEQASFWERTAQTFDRLAAAEPARFVVVAAGDPLDEVVETVVDEVTKRWL